MNGNKQRRDAWKRLLAELDEVASKTRGPSGAAQAAEQIREAGEGVVPDRLLAVVAEAAQGPAGGVVVALDPVLSALNEWSKTVEGRDWSAVELEETRQRRATSELAERAQQAYERALAAADERRVKRLLGRRP